MFQKLLLLLALVLIYCSNKNSAIITAIGFSILGYFVTNFLIPKVGPSFIKIGLFGKDLSKPGKPVLPETIGAVSAIVYLFVVLSYIPFIFYKYMVVTTSGGGERGNVIPSHEESLNSTIFPHDRLCEYLSSILCLQSTILLGIADDLFDLRWRHKFFLPIIGSIPLLVIYYVDFGVTYVLIPGFIQRWMQLTASTIDLGGLYYVYMAAMGIFCPNSINILAGVNGLEVGQSIVLGILELLNDTLYLTLGSKQARAAHRFSAVLIIPFLGVSLALWKWNRWPAKVFVGDTYCYFAGMVFAVVGILGHFSKTILLLFIPQILNFLYSCPQLFKIVPCPRHRLPHFNEEDGLMYPSVANLKDEPPKSWFIPILRLLNCFKLIQLEFDDKDKSKIISCSNMTLINLTLVWFGPMREDRLCNRILQIQFLIGLLALFARHAGGAMLFGHDNLWT